MNTIPNDLNFKKLQGCLIQQIFYSYNSISLLFNNREYITIRGLFILTNDGISKYEEISTVESDYGFLKLLEKTVKTIETDAKRTDLILTFDNDSKLQIIGDKYYESYTIKVDDIEYSI